MGDRVEVSQVIDAPADELYAMISDVTRMGEWSPETTRCKWVGGAHGPAVGARFKGDNEHGKKRWSITSEVVIAEPGSHFAFEPKIGPLRYARWGYEFAPVDEGTKVTEYVVDRRGAVSRWAGTLVSGVSDRETHNRETMAATLERLRQVAESSER